MDKFSSRKAANGTLSFSRKASSGLVLRDASEKPDRSTHLCSRVGCGSRINPSKGNQVVCSGKAKTTRHPFRFPNSGKEIVGSSSRTPLSPSIPRKQNPEPWKKLPSHVVADMETSSFSEESVDSEPVIDPDNTQVRLNTFAQNKVLGEASSSNSIPHSRNGKKTMSLGSPASLAFKHGNNHGVKNGASTSKYNFRNLKCNSRNDVVSSDLDKKRMNEGQGSLFTRGKTNNNGPVIDDRRSDRSRSGISIASSRRTRNSTFTRVNDQEDRNNGITIGSSENQFHSQASSRRMNVPRRPGNSHANINNNGSLVPFDSGYDSSFLNAEEEVGHYRLDGIAEMLLALDGIEQDEEPMNEQLLDMETNIFLSGLSFHDQLRDMRLDIDNMSYEELLALEERMGTVSTALTEEALENCLKRSIYQAVTTEEGIVVGEGDDTKCCICQEDYEEGNEVGRLGCDHQYDVGCIQKWLRMKNWCPICKASATPSPNPA